MIKAWLELLTYLTANAHDTKKDGNRRSDSNRKSRAWLEPK